jgi:hypothetical protein
MNRDFLKEAIADAKTVKESAIANAKIALEEAFSPKLQAMFAQRLEEMDKEEMEEGYDEVDEEVEMVDEEMSEKEEDMDLDEILAELEELEDLETEEITEAEEEEAEVEDETEEDEVEVEDEDETEEDEEIDLDDMSEEDLKSFIEDVIADMVQAGELEAGDAVEDEEEKEEVMEYSLADMSTQEFLEYCDENPNTPGCPNSPFNEGIMEARFGSLADLSTEEFLEFCDENPNTPGCPNSPFNEGIKRTKRVKKTNEAYSPEMLYNVPEYQKMIAVLAPLLASLTGFAVSYVKDKLSKGGDEAEKLINVAKKQSGSQAMTMNEALKTVKILKSELNEINLLNAKLLYSNKIFKAKNLNEAQKVKVLGAFDKAETVKEAKIVFETLNESFKSVRKTVNEGIIGSASKATLVPKTSKKPIVESDEMVNRFKKLAGII